MKETVYSKYGKRVIDIMLSIIALIILAVPMLIIACVIKIDSKGPVFFKQERLGKDGAIFEIIKFRTMVINAENIGDGLSIKTDSDNRITKVGSFLRKTSLDEISQLLNVLKGNMSLIGPRPPVTYHPYVGIDSYPEWSKVRFTIRPGITGLAQVEVRNSVPWDDRMKFDVKYVESISLLEDIKIFIRTSLKVFSKVNIY